MPIDEPLDATQEAPQDTNEELAQAVSTLFMQARAYKSQLQNKLSVWRAMFDMQPPVPPFEGALAASAPVVRQKADGIRAHIKVAIDREPFFTLRAYSSEGEDVAPALEAVMEHELRISGSKANIERAIDDAVVYGTGILKIAVSQTDERGLPVVGLKHVPLKNVWAWPDKYDPKNLVWFEAFWQPRWLIEELAKSGVYDEEAVRQLDELSTTGGSYTEDDMGANVTSLPEQRWHELVEAWLMYRGSLHRVVFTAHGTIVLRVERDPLGGVFDFPPYFPLYIDPDTVSIWGHGISEILEHMQVVSDAALNNELWSAQYKMRPPVLVRAGSQLYRVLEQAGGLFPGQVIPFDGADAENVLRIVEYSMNPFNMQVLSLMNQLTEDATMPDFMVPGTPLGGRRTATEVQVMSSIGQLKLANFLRHVQRGLEEIAKHYWKAVVGIRIRNANMDGLPPGVYRAWSYSGGGKVYLAERTVDIVWQAPDGTFYQIYIPAALRDDAEWVLTGSITVPERELRLQRISTLLNPTLIQYIQLARRDHGIHTLMRRFLDAHGMAHDADAILGPPPQAMSPGEAVMQGLLEGMTGMAQGGENAQTGPARAAQTPTKTSGQGGA